MASSPTAVMAITAVETTGTTISCLGATLAAAMIAVTEVGTVGTTTDRSSLLAPGWVGYQ